MTSGRSSRGRRGVVVLALVPALCWLPGCSRAVDGEPTAGPISSLPDSPAELEVLIVDDVPSALPRLPDEELQPPAGAKRVEDVAGYSDDPARDREILEDYGYRHGWERFWGLDDGLVTGVFVDQFRSRAGAGSYAEDLARNDAELYHGRLQEDPPDLPAGCRMLTVDGAGQEGLEGPAAFAWCGRGPFSVSVTAVAGDADAAELEVRAVLAEQLDRLPQSRTARLRGRAWAPGREERRRSRGTAPSRGRCRPTRGA